MSGAKTAIPLGNVGLNPRGAYDAQAEYAFLDMVSHGGGSWVALQACTGQTPREGAYWTLNSARGEPQIPANLYGNEQVPANVGVVTFFDDDGHVRFFTEHVPLYRKYGVRASVAVIAGRAENPVGTTTSGDPYEAMSWEQLREIAGDGFDIQNHTYSHDRVVFEEGANAAATDEDICREIGEGDRLLRAHGFDPNCIVYPWGAATERNRRCARRYAQYAVSLGAYPVNAYESTEPLNIQRANAKAAEDVPVLKGMIDRVRDNGGWLIICTHAGGDAPPPGAFEELLAYAAGSGVRIETFRGAAAVKAPRISVGLGEQEYRLRQDGLLHATLDDASVSRLIARAKALGLLAASEPSEYAEMDYIATSPDVAAEGKPVVYLDTGYVPTRHTRIELDAHLLGTGAVLGLREPDNSQCCYLYYTAYDQKLLKAAFGGGESAVEAQLTDARHLLGLSAAGMTVDGVSAGGFADGQAFSTTRSILLFNRNEDVVSRGRNMYMRLYRCRIYEGDELAMDLAPAVDGRGTPALWDTVSKRYVSPEAGMAERFTAAAKQ